MSMFQKVIFLIIGLAIISIVILELNVQRGGSWSDKTAASPLWEGSSPSRLDGDRGASGGKLASLRRPFVTHPYDGAGLSRTNTAAGRGGADPSLTPTLTQTYWARKSDTQFASIVSYLSYTTAAMSGGDLGDREEPLAPMAATAGGEGVRTDDYEARLLAVLAEEEAGAVHNYRWDKRGGGAAATVPDVSSAVHAILALMARGASEQLTMATAARSSSKAIAGRVPVGVHLKDAYPASTAPLGHPSTSPRNGTCASSAAEVQRLLRCRDQAGCLVPHLQLATPLRVYMCKHPARHGVRFYYLVAEGLRAHPGVTLVQDMFAADFVLYLPGSAPWHLTECTPKRLRDRLVVLDEFDGHPLYYPHGSKAAMEREYGPDMVWNFMMFKRSYNARRDGSFVSYPHVDRRDVFPLTYAIAEAYSYRGTDLAADARAAAAVGAGAGAGSGGGLSLELASREVDIVCTLRGHRKMSTRQRVQDWVAEYAAERGIAADKVVLGAVNKGSRDRVNEAYFEQMRVARIVVTVNPAHWEGDFRLWEALAAGALVFVDRMFTPHPYPLRDGVHVVYFNNSDRTDLFRKLDRYRADPALARAVAINGYLHAMTHHRTVNLVDYILRTAHAKAILMGGTGSVAHNSNFNNDYFQHPSSLQLPYTYTGQHFVREMKRQLGDVMRGRWLDVQ